MMRSALCSHLLVLFCLIGCSARIQPPAHPRDPVRVFIADYGRHASILLPDDDGKFIEFAWGDFDWFAANHNGIGEALAALFWSRGSALGTRRLDEIPPSG